ncbi:MAG: InlB B-repeat-containing protein [Anaerovoracaceae bacterium]
MDPATAVITKDTKFVAVYGKETIPITIDNSFFLSKYTRDKGYSLDGMKVRVENEKTKEIYTFDGPGDEVTANPNVKKYQIKGTLPKYNEDNTLAVYRYLGEKDIIPNLCYMQLDGVNYNYSSSNTAHTGGAPVKFALYWFEELTPQVGVEFIGQAKETSLTFTQMDGLKGVTFDPDKKVTHTFNVPKAQNTNFSKAFQNRNIARKFEWLRVPVVSWNHMNVGDRDMLVEGADLDGYAKELTGNYRDGWKLTYTQQLKVTYDLNENGTSADALEEVVLHGKSPIAVPEVAAKEGYRFLGWTLDDNQGGEPQLVDPTTTVITKDTKFTAVYEETTIPITIDNSFFLTKYTRDKGYSLDGMEVKVKNNKTGEIHTFSGPGDEVAANPNVKKYQIKGTLPKYNKDDSPATYSYVQPDDIIPNLCTLQLDGVNYNGPSGNIYHEPGEPVKLNLLWIEELTPRVDVEFAGEPMETSLKFTQKGRAINVGGQATFDPDHKVDHTFDLAKAQNTHFSTAFQNRDIASKFDWLRVPAIIWNTTNTGDRDMLVEGADLDGYAKELTGNYRDGWKLTYTQQLKVTYDLNENGTSADALEEVVLHGKSPIAVPKVTAKEGYRFLGWTLYDNQGGEPQLVDPTTTIITKDTKFVAVYEKIEQVPEEPTDPEKPDAPGTSTDGKAGKVTAKKGGPKTGDEGMMGIFILLMSGAAVVAVRTAKSRG